MAGPANQWFSLISEMKYWEIIVNKMIKARFSVGRVSAIDNDGRTIWVVDAHRDGKRFVVRRDL